ncbi:MAG: helix-turn-helix transcriptional regulator [Candidatus Eiseniibacteriota bacterium]
MAESKSKRLIDLLTLLLSSRYPVSKNAIRRLAGYPRGEEAFHRQFERDKQALRELGFPLREVADEDEGGYALERARLRLPEVHLTAEETVALALARRLGGFHALVGSSVRDALGKIGILAADAQSLPGVAYAAPPSRSKSEEERLRSLESAVARGHRLKLRYRKLGEAKGLDRDVDPYGLYVFGGGWYLVAFDHLRRGMRTFRTSRIEKLSRATRSAGPDFDVPREFKIEDYVERMRMTGWRTIVEDAVVRFAPSESWRVSRLGGPRQRVKRLPGGALEVRFRRANPDAIVTWVAGLGRGVEIVEPLALREEARRFAERVAKAHTGAPHPERRT